VPQTIEALVGVVAPEVLIDAVETSARLSELGVPHVLIGGLAVGLHGYPRATKDVDYMVGIEAFEKTVPLLLYRDELRDVARVGVIDLMAVPPSRPGLARFLDIPAPGQIPVLPVEALILLKLDANRPQDRADVIMLVRRGAVVDAVSSFIAKEGPELMARFAELLQEQR
jgi:hypothetical protein